MAATETVTLRLVAQDLMSGNVTKAISGLDALAKKGGLVGSVMQGVGQSFGQMLNPVALVANGIGMVTDFMGDAVEAASDMNEAQSKVNVVFGDQADIIRDWARTSATSMGLSERAALKAAGTFGNLFDGLGLTEQATTDLSQKVVQLAADLGSFNNVATDEALQALQSGLLGEAEPMRRFGVALSEAKVQAFGMANGLGELVKSGKTFKFIMSDAQKVQARFGLILEGTANAQGDFARTADGLANSQKTLAANIDNLTTSLGQLLTGPATVFTGFLNDLATMFLPRSDAALDSATRWLKTYTEQTLHAAQAQEQLNEAIDAGPKPIDIFTKSLDSWIVKQGDLLAQLDTTGELARMLQDVNRRLAFTTGLTAEEIFQLAQVTQIAGGDIDDLTVAMQKLIGSGIDMKGMAMRYVHDFDIMNMSAEQFERTFLSLGVQVQNGKMTWQDWGRTMMAFVPFIKEHFAEFPEWLQASLMKANLGLDESLMTMKATATSTLGGMVSEVRAQVHGVPTVFREALTPLASIVKGTLKEARETAKREMAELAWALKHPMQDAKLRQVWVGELRGAYKGLHQAQETNNRIAIAKAQALIDGLRAKIFELDMAQLAIRVDYTLRGTERPLGNPPPPPRKAGGGPVSAGGSYLVGEDGPELLTLGTSSGYVTPNHAMGGVHVHLHGFLAAPSEAQLSQVARTIGPAVRRELARAGG